MYVLIKRLCFLTVIFYHKSFVYLFLLSRKALKIDVSWSLFLFKLLKKIQDDCYLFLTLMTITSYSIKRSLVTLFIVTLVPFIIFH